ncbi:unnamed protein product [Phytophthora fragariaefolia]|uniref:Unnamed protein product n=1 Tax=Phytophthora fragariaefolia TaxID=1490495 RepID=A0A9W7D779_9STRA|nr:unnamed protein product [Phytophthora fragariaefolia]
MLALSTWCYLGYRASLRLRKPVDYVEVRHGIAKDHVSDQDYVDGDDADNEYGDEVEEDDDDADDEDPIKRSIEPVLQRIIAFFVI